MARFQYQARDGRGELANGVITAPSLEEAGKMLRGEGKFIVKLTAASESTAAAAEDIKALASGRVKRQDVIYFTHQLAVMIETGVPISEALDCLTEQTITPPFKSVLADVTKSVQSGGELSTALKKHPRVFPNVMTALVKASEISGTMGAMLDRVSRYLAKEAQTARQIRGALAYPMFMMVMAIGVTVFLLAFVLPRFAAIYSSRQAVLPAPTRLLMAISHGMVTYWYIWITLAVGSVIAYFILRRTKSGRRGLDWVKLHIPILGPLFRSMYVSRATRTMSTMLAAGVSILDMVAIVRQVTDNVYFEDLWDKVDERLRQGAQFSECLNGSKLFPRSVTQMIFSGEKSGRLGQVLARVAEHTESELDESVKTATQFIEPLMIGVMGGVIGFVAISLLLPIFSVGKVMSGT